jgi:hypothetical protein
MVSRVGRKGLCGEKPVDLKLVWTLFKGEPFQHDWFTIRDASCVHAEA